MVFFWGGGGGGGGAVTDRDMTVVDATERHFMQSMNFGQIPEIFVKT